MDNASTARHEAAVHSDRRTAMVQDAAILKLARSTIRLSQVAPRLSELAVARQTEALHQAEQLRSSAAMVQQMSATLQHTMQQLRLSTGEIGELTNLIKRIADETRMISINAGIVAARNADDQGRAFAVLAKEIRQLSENTADATRDVHGRVMRLEENTQRTVRTIGLDEGDQAQAMQPGLARLRRELEETNAAAARHLREAQELNELGLDLRSLSQDMIGAVGAFRMEAHDLVERLVQELRHGDRLKSGDGRRQVEALREVLRRTRSVELAYVTNMAGIQTLPNVTRHNLQSAWEPAGRPRDWSTRGWFLGAKHTRGVHLSDIYRSDATDEFCLTAAATFTDARGVLAGVVALDVNFREILGG
ncbi:MAG: methyl-accepting chemotaxis protein [Gammaproteobacteria bacterium]